MSGEKNTKKKTETAEQKAAKKEALNRTRNLKQLKKRLKREKLTYSQMSSFLGVSQPRVKQYLEILRETGVEVPFDKQGRQHYFWIPSVPLRRNKKNEFDIPKDSQGYTVLGIISDTHIGSKYHNSEALEKMYDEFERNKVKFVLNAGDLTEGNGRLYRGQLQEVSHFGFEALVKHTVKTYPKRKGVRTGIISGNHDMSFWNDVGADIVKHISNQRDDFDYLGQLSGWVDVNSIEIYMVHPSGGMPYSRSYKIQKQIEQMVTKPDVLVRGHLHVSMYLPYVGVQGIEAGCFQNQTPYLERKGLRPEVGGWIVKIKQNEVGDLKEVIPIWNDYSNCF